MKKKVHTEKERLECKQQHNMRDKVFRDQHTPNQWQKTWKMPSIYRCHLNFGVWLMQLNCLKCVVKHTSTTKVQQIQKKDSGYSSRRSIWHCLYLRRRIFGVILRNRFFHWKVDKIHNNCIWYYDSGETNNILIHQIKLRPFSTNLIVIRFF